MKLGFVGGVGHHYLRGLIQDPEAAGGGPVEIAFASDGHDPQAAATFARSLALPAGGGTPPWFDDPLRLMDEFRPDVLSVGAVYGFAGDINAAALGRGIPTVSDKPVATTWRQLGRLRELAAADPSRTLLTEFDFRARSEFRAARAAVARGLIGQPVLATAQKSYRFGTRPAWYADREKYGGLLLWVASHGVDAVAFVTGKRFARATGRQGNLSQPAFGSMEDHVAVLFELEGGGTAVVHADFLRPPAAASHGDDRLRVAGTRGVVEVRDGRCRLVTTQQPDTDITDSGDGRPMHLALLAALRGEKESYSTALSLETAEVLLRARDAADAQAWTDFAGRP